jgi:hypothetical protein
MFSSARRLASLRHPRLALATVVVGCLAAPPVDVEAATRYAGPTGTGTAPCLEPTAPCDLETAVAFGNTTAGDTILLAPGTYHPIGSVEVFRPVTISGEAGKPAPLIEAGGSTGLFMWEPSTVRDIRIESPPGTNAGLVSLAAGSEIERVESSGEANRACAFGGGTIRDTLCSATPVLGGGEGVEMFVSGPTPETYETTLFNVTAVGGSTGFGVGANEHSTVILKATNTIVFGRSADIVADSLATTAPVVVDLSHSNFEDIETEGTAVSVTSSVLAGNQSAEPLFVDAAAGNYREVEGSPTRLAGDLGVLPPGELDLDGNPRTTNCAGTIGVDIGAYQFECPAAPDQHEQSGGGTTSTTGTASPPPAKTAPQLSRFSIRPTKFVVAGAGKVPKGTARSAVVSFTLSAPASVKLDVLSKKAVKGKKPKLVKVGQLSKAGVTGANTVKLSSKLNGKALEPGKYTLRVTASAAGLSSAPLTKTFAVLAAAS